MKKPKSNALPTPRILALSMGIGIVAAFVARALGALIALVTNLAFFGRWCTQVVAPGDAHLGVWGIGIPVAGAILVGLMARFGSAAIRGHGIPEAMEQVLFNKSRIPLRVMFLKPLSAALSIGTGGPFGAEGPIIATGGAFGSVIGQILPVTSDERKTLLAAGAAAGMTATFGSPVAAVLLAVELLLFEYRVTSLVPVALASVAATIGRIAVVGSVAAFHLPVLDAPSASAVVTYALIGIPAGVFAAFATKAVYWIEDAFEKLPFHWMWWPAVGAIAVGVVGYFEPRTLGVGYSNIDAILSGDVPMIGLISLGTLKFISWSIALGSGTSGGTLAPLFTVGAALGGAIGLTVAAMAPRLGIDPRLAALVGMAATFAGASRALLASIVFAFETTGQSATLLPLLGGCALGYLASAALSKNSIMTERLARRGITITSDYTADTLALEPAVKRARMDSLPIADASEGDLAIAEAMQADPGPMCLSDVSLRHAADLMLRSQRDWIMVFDKKEKTKLVGVLTRKHILEAYGARLESSEVIEPPTLVWKRRRA